ncbi:MAG: hypothetical protein ACYC56_15030 [Candidatus Aquicultor sp.]
MGRLARINAERKAVGLPVDDNGYHRKPQSTRVTPVVRNKMVLASLLATIKGGGK